MIVTVNTDTVQSFENKLMHTFSIRDLNNIELFLGFKVPRNNGEITLDQKSYVKTALNEQADCISIDTPIESKINNESFNIGNYNAPCRSVIGSLMYLMICERLKFSCQFVK